MYSIEQLANDFRKLGIRAADTVMLHARCERLEKLPEVPITYILPSNRC